MANGWFITQQTSSVRVKMHVPFCLLHLRHANLCVGVYWLWWGILAFYLQVRPDKHTVQLVRFYGYWVSTQADQSPEILDYITRFQGRVSCWAFTSYLPILSIISMAVPQIWGASGAVFLSRDFSTR